VLENDLWDMAKREGYEVTDEWLEQIKKSCEKRMYLINVDLGMLGWNGLNGFARKVLLRFFSVQSLCSL